MFVYLQVFVCLFISEVYVCLFTSEVHVCLFTSRCLYVCLPQKCMYVCLPPEVFLFSFVIFLFIWYLVLSSATEWTHTGKQVTAKPHMYLGAKLSLHVLTSQSVSMGITLLQCCSEYDNTDSIFCGGDCMHVYSPLLL